VICEAEYGVPTLHLFPTIAGLLDTSRITKSFRFHWNVKTRFNQSRLATV